MLSLSVMCSISWKLWAMWCRPQDIYANAVVLVYNNGLPNSLATQEMSSSTCTCVSYCIYIFATHCGYRKGQRGEKQVSEGSYELNVFFPFHSFQRIFQAGDSIENGLQELNSLQQMRAFSFALINTFFTDAKLYPSGSNVDFRRRGLLAVLVESQFEGWSSSSLGLDLAAKTDWVKSFRG